MSELKEEGDKFKSLVDFLSFHQRNSPSSNEHDKPFDFPKKEWGDEVVDDTNHEMNEPNSKMQKSKDENDDLECKSHHYGEAFDLGKGSFGDLDDYEKENFDTIHP